ncbi:SDR family NAD(P)-dependent oxidoreductase [Chloroflexi bacterium TSY]|nr:SDR family NAD(P)-dependent oxidoreductase [Chloroflexi bacterium TSY]
MRDKICLITGANSGIGFELAKGMAENDYITILLYRNRESGEIAKNKIINATSNEEVHLMIADLSSQLSIRAFVNEFGVKFDHLDVLFRNAGANFFERQLSVDNIEMTFATNYLASFLLTKLLLPKLKKAIQGKSY